MTVLTGKLGLTFGQACGSFSATADCNLVFASGQTGVREMESQLTTLFYANTLDSASAFTLSLINYTDGLDACNKGRESAVTEVSRGMYVAFNIYTKYRSIRKYVTILNKGYNAICQL
jgi:hypothetical protein